MMSDPRFDDFEKRIAALEKALKIKGREESTDSPKPKKGDK